MSCLIHICACSFAGCDAITTLTLPKSITSIGKKAFGCKCSGVNGRV